MEGLSYLKEDTREQIDLAIQKFKEVLRMDTTYVPAHLALTDAYLKIVNEQWDRNPVWLRLAQDAAQKAMQIDQGSAEGYLRLGNIYLMRGDFKHADEEFRKALKYNSNLEYGWIGLGKVFSHFGLYYPCLEAYDKALSLNPKNSEVTMSRAMILTGLGKYSKAEEEIQRAIRFQSNKVYLNSFLALVKYYLDDLKEAERNVQIGIKSQEYLPFSHAVLAMIYAKKGEFDKALAEVELEVKPFAGNDASLASAVAAVYSLLGRNGQAIQWLEKAVSWGYGEYPWLANDPNFRGMRGDERYNKILNEMKQVWEYNMSQYSAFYP
jgi:tetratricopeptide (TPR) repeat protein